MPRTRRRHFHSLRQVALITLACAFVLGSFYALSLLGPASYSVGSRKAPVSREQAERLRSTAEEAEERWNAIKRNRTITKTAFTEDDLRAIGEAAIARLQYENQVHDAESRYTALRKELHDRAGELLRAKSVGLENEALREERARNFAGAESLYRQAGEVENRLVAEFPESSFKNMQRIVFLDNRTRLMKARPLWEQSLASEKSAETALSRSDIPGAIAALDAAVSANRRLEQEFRGLTPADSFRYRSLERRLATLRSLTVRNRALAILDRAEKAALSRDYDMLPVWRKEVEDAAREIAEKYPDSEYAQPAALADLVRRAQNAASTPDAEAVEKSLKTLGEALRKGDKAAAAMIENLARTVEQVRGNYPESDRIGKETADRIAFLFQHRTEVALIASTVSASLRPMPGLPSLRVMRTETPQRLYALVMGENPSAATGDMRPVESLTRDEARLFCQRLGWMIARTVRLPDEGEFRALAGKPDAARLSAFARAIDNSDGSAAPVPAAKPDAADIADLLGNVAEWLEPPAGANPAEGLVAGGDAESTLVQLARVPVVRRPASERSRFVGFRFIVEEPEAR